MNAMIDLVTLVVVLVWWLIKATSLLIVFGVLVWLLGLFLPVVIHAIVTIFQLLTSS